MNASRILLGFSALCALTSPIASFADERSGDQLGVIRLEVTGEPAVREHVVRGTKLLHHMMYPEADREFAAATAIDPQCALAWWGRAMTLLHPLWPDVPSEAERQQGAAFLERGRASKTATARERAYLEALAAYFRPDAGPDHPARLKALDVASGELAERFPDDLDALAFSALFHLAPARFLTKDKSHRVQLEAAERLAKILALLPTHPGAQHYKIHAYDFPLLADRALEVCDTYSSIAPDVPHALHMPTHIFTRRGLWEQSIEYNRRAALAAQKIAEQAGALNGHLPHSLDYLVYAHLQRGQFAEAERLRAELASLKGPYLQTQPGAMAFAFAAVPARCALERQRWNDAAALPLRQPESFAWGDAFLNCDSIVRFARAIGAARSGQRDAAEREIAALEQLRQKLAASRTPPYWTAQAETQLLAARAWVQFSAGQTESAIAAMRKAAEIEATTDKEAVTPGEVLPAGDLLGDLLLEAGKPKDALAAFEAVLAASPNRFNTVYGAGLAAERASDAATARRYYEQLVVLGKDADAGNEQLAHARRYLFVQAEKRLGLSTAR